MPKRSPPKVMYRVMLPAELVPKIDKIIHDEQYAGRNDFTVRLIRNYLDEKEERDKISKQYEMFEADKKRRLKESSLDNENEE
ncbi:hypothetical protein [Candidatus Methanomassiliicoccus intestinalis]|mgnify:FL=1|nr:hypothetical protein [Candidatus Methanomassiliicoccus intestinalis]